MNLLEQLLVRFPWLKEFLSTADRYMGPVVGGTIFALILLVFYWTFFVVPKRVHRLMAGLSKKGYADIDPANSRLSETVEKLAPIYGHHPRQGHPIPPWKIIKAVSNSCRGGTRYLVYTSRTQIEWSGSGSGNTNFQRYSVMALERRKLPFAETIHLKPAKNPERVKCDDRLQLKKVMPLKLTSFYNQYALFTQSGAMTAFPEKLEEVLTTLLPLFILQDGPAVHIWDVNLKFSQEGWGILSSEQIYKPEPMAAFIEAADRISDTLSAFT